MAVDDELNVALVSNSKDDTVSVIDLTTPEVISTIVVDRSPKGIAINPLSHTALVANYRDATISVIDLREQEVIETINTVTRPQDIAIDPELNIALVTGRELHVIDLTTYEVIESLIGGEGFGAVDINPETHRAAVANKKDNTITVIDLLTYESTTFPVGKHPIDIRFNPLDNYILVLCKASLPGKNKHPRIRRHRGMALVLIEPDSGEVIKDYPLGKRARAAALNPAANVAGVINDKTKSLTLIELPYPIPEIISLTPKTVLRGSTSASISIKGSGFIKSSSVTFLTPAPYNLYAYFIDNHSLEVQIPEELLHNAGVFELMAVNPSPEGGASNRVDLKVENPAPAISSLNPEQTLSGTAELTLTVKGSGFFDDTTVYVKGVEKEFTLNNSSQFELTLTAEDLGKGASLEIRASNPAPGGGVSAPALLRVLNPTPLLSSLNPPSISAGSPELTLTLSGENFRRTSTVSFNNQHLPAVYINSTELEAALPSESLICVLR